MKHLLLMLTLLSAAAAQQYAIVDVRVTGSKRFPETEIIRASALEKGAKNVTLERVKEGAGRLLALGAFQEVGYRYNLVPGGLKLEFTVTDASRFVPAEFDNIVWLAPDELQQALRAQVPLFDGTLPAETSGSLPGDVASALERILRERGVPATVTFLPSATPQGEMRGYLYTAEGVTIKIAQVNLAGASPGLSTQVEAAARPLLGRAYHRSDLNDFIQHTMLPVYLRRGYLRAEFGAPGVTVVSQQQAETAVAVTLPVEEGRPYAFAGVRWSGNQVFSAQQLTQMLHVASGQPMDAPRLADDLSAIVTQYGQQGYVKAALDPKPAFDDQASAVKYEIAVHEGDKYTMGKLEIAGLQPASAEKVRQRWRMREGEPFDPGYVSKFFRDFRLPRGFAFKAETSDGETPHSLDLTLIFCRAETKCLPSASNSLTLDDEERR